jgi:3-phosphoshikimate 1-carboxyvinyltransferase
MAALAEGESIIINPLKSDDTKFMIDALKNLGIEIKEEMDRIFIRGGSFKIKNNELFCGIAGTTSRFLTALAAILSEEIVISGEGKLLERPIEGLVEGLKQIGVEVEYLGRSGSIPLKINGADIHSGMIKMKGDVSSQFFTALLLIAPKLESGLEIEVVGSQVSKSYIDMTIQGMKEFGVEVENQNYEKYIVKGGQNYSPRTYKIEGDWSSASYFLALAAVYGDSFEVKNLNLESAQGDKEFLTVLKKAGVEFSQDNSSIIINKSEIKPFEINMGNMPDTAMTAAILACFAKGTSKITGLSTLKVKETDRITAMHKEFKKLGIETRIGSDFIEIDGKGRLDIVEPIVIETYHDHRIAMAFAILASLDTNIYLDNPDVVSKSFPSFWEELRKLGFELDFVEKS